MADESVEIGEDIQTDIVLDAEGNVVGAVVDDLVVATSDSGSIVDETIDVLGPDGELLLEDEKISVYDADANLVAQEETIIAALDD
jgi:hypothetical protein